MSQGLSGFLQGAVDPVGDLAQPVRIIAELAHAFAQVTHGLRKVGDDGAAENVHLLLDGTGH
ncbi:hypothetical protein D3C75_1178200 [compost metagenome]